MKKILLSLLLTFMLCPTVMADQALTPMTLILDWFPNPNQAPLFVAQQQGFFKQQGLDVKLVSPADPADAPKLVAAGKAELGISYQSGLMFAVARGLPLVRIATLIDSPLNCVAVLKSSDIKSVKDLKGKTIGYASGGEDRIVLKTMLEHAGLSLSDVDLINVHYNLAQALLSQRVDAITGAMRNFEVPEMALAGKPARAFYPENSGVPPYDELIIIANRDELKDPNLKKFLHALQQGTSYLLAHPLETWKTFAKQHPESNNQLNKQAWFATLKYFAKHPAKLNKQQYNNFAAFLQQQGAIAHAPPVKDYAVQL